MKAAIRSFVQTVAMVSWVILSMLVVAWWKTGGRDSPLWIVVMALMGGIAWLSSRIRYLNDDAEADSESPGAEVALDDPLPGTDPLANTDVTMDDPLPGTDPIPCTEMAVDDPVPSTEVDVDDPKKDVKHGGILKFWHNSRFFRLWSTGSVVWAVLAYLFFAMVMPDPFMSNAEFSGWEGSEMRTIVFFMAVPPALALVGRGLFKLR